MLRDAQLYIALIKKLIGEILTQELDCTMEAFKDRFYPKMGSSTSILTIFLQAVEEWSTGFLRFDSPN